MSKVIKVFCCAVCPHIRVGYNPEKETYWDYCNVKNGRKIENEDEIPDFCPLQDDPNPSSGCQYKLIHS